MRTTRNWACVNCGAAYHRLKDNSNEPVRCHRCGRHRFKPTRGWSKWMQSASSRYHREQARQGARQALIVDRYSKPRGAYGNVLAVSTETKQAWRWFCKSKNRRSFENRGQKFLDALAVDIWTCPHFRPPSLGHHSRPCKCSGGGVIGSPAFLVDPQLEDWGDYRSGLGQIMRGAKNMPRIQTIRIRRVGDTDLLSTVVHETQHWVDSFSVTGRAVKVCAGSHSRAFYDRVRWLGRKLGHDVQEGKALGGGKP